MLFLIGALRAVVEMIGLCLLGRGVLHVVAGRRRERNLIYRFFVLVTEPPCHLVRVLLPAVLSDRAIPAITFVFLAALWMALAWLRKFL